MSDDTKEPENKKPDNAPKTSKPKAGTSALNDDAKTYASRLCPSCGRAVKVRTYPRATVRETLEKYPKHNDGIGQPCRASAMTMRDARQIFGNVVVSEDA